MKIHVAPEGGGWPSRDDLIKMVDEASYADLNRLGGGEGVSGLCKRLGADPQQGLPKNGLQFKERCDAFGANSFAEKKLTSYCEYVYMALHDKLLIMMLTMAIVEIIYWLIKRKDKGWIDPTAIFVTVMIIVNVQSALDWKRERMFDSLNKKLSGTNLRFIIRSGETIKLSDDQIVVGDVVSFNSHLAATIPADCVLIEGEGIKCDESPLTGEPEPISKDVENPFMISGTTVSAGSGKMLVVAVGENSVSGKIKKAVYDSDGGEESPLFIKLDLMAGRIGLVGMFVAVVCFVSECIKGFGIDKKPADKIIVYIMEALGILAVAIPEGLPLAQTISLAFTSTKMSNENNLVKTLNSCETMGSATTICTDKTGTLTTNRMTVKAAYIGCQMVAPANDTLAAKVSDRLRACKDLSEGVFDILANLTAICTMDESQVKPPIDGGIEPIFEGNPTECAMLRFADDLGYKYARIRADTVGRSETTRKAGVSFPFSSARKIMSWAVPRDGGFRVYVKGAAEIILERSVAALDGAATVHPIRDTDKAQITKDCIDLFASRAMRCIGMGYKDVDGTPDDGTDASVLNTDGSAAFCCEIELVLVGIVGIEDPLRPEVPIAIQKCYRAGVDVRMVTGDNIATAIAIARGAGILRDEHFYPDGTIKPDRAIEGKEFRKRVLTETTDGEVIFRQEKFDAIWPYLRVMARSSPEDKLTLATGLGDSHLFENVAEVGRLKSEGITVFPDRQVVAMTGDGTNDAPALKAAGVGFAMGISGTQIAKDAANIILLDDNFASIVTAAKWGRNVYDSIQKFLQFQLTVNVSILAISLIVTFTDKDRPLSVTQMLWLNLIMDSLAALALASEAPTDAQLNRPPVNRSQFLITEQMWWNMIGQSCYQVTCVCLLFFNEDLPDCDDPDAGKGHNSKHYTIIFNAFVLMQLFNEFNSRKLLGEFNILTGILDNRLFLGISFITFVLQGLMTQFGGHFLKLHPDGLTGRQWLLCLGLGAGPLIWQVLINICTRSMRYVFLKSNIRGLSEVLKFGGPKQGHENHRIAAGRSSKGSFSERASRSASGTFLADGDTVRMRSQMSFQK